MYIDILYPKPLYDRRNYHEREIQQDTVFARSSNLTGEENLLDQIPSDFLPNGTFILWFDKEG